MTSQPLDILVSVARNGSGTLGRQIEDQLRAAIRENTLRPGTRIPLTRDLARELGVSRPIVVGAYAQLAAEGYLVLRQGARPRVSDCVGPCRAPAALTAPQSTEPRFDFRLGVPDLASFPRSMWLRSLRDALGRMPDADLGYTDPHGSEVLRAALTEYLGRVRGVVTDRTRVFVTSGYAQGRALVVRALVAAGARRIAIEEPCNREVWETMERAGLEMIRIPVDGAGMQVERLARTKADAVLVTPAHHYPTGVVLSGERRAGLLEWLRRRDAIGIEDDYDAEYRYDRAPVGALQPLDAERIVYAGTASKTLAPALRLGWLVVPPRLVDGVAEQQSLADFGGPRIEQHAFADFLSRGELDRHLRRMRGRYRARRDALVDAVHQMLPEASICGIAAGLHATIRLPAGYDDRIIRDRALRRGIALSAMSDYFLGEPFGPPTLILGYARSSEPTIRAGVKALAAVVRKPGPARPT